MRILLTNDDGISAPGLAVAEEIAHDLAGPEGEVWVVAPAFEQSGVAHSVSYVRPMRLERLEPRRFAVEGSPADCVLAGLHEILKETPPDLVLSGVNRGHNVAEDTLYSGTVGGALEAVINGFPAIALSLDIPASGLWHFALAAELCAPIIAAALEHGVPEWSALNVNIPNIPQADVKGTRLTQHGKSGFKEYYVEEAEENGRRKFRLEGSMAYRDQDTWLDAIALKEGYISVTPLGLNMFNQTAYDHFKKWPAFGATR